MQAERGVRVARDCECDDDAKGGYKKTAPTRACSRDIIYLTEALPELLAGAEIGATKNTFFSSVLP